MLSFTKMSFSRFVSLFNCFLLICLFRKSKSSEEIKRNPGESAFQTNRLYEGVQPHSSESILDLSAERTENEMNDNAIYQHID